MCVVRAHDPRTLHSLHKHREEGIFGMAFDQLDIVFRVVPARAPSPSPNGPHQAWPTQPAEEVAEMVRVGLQTETSTTSIAAAPSGKEGLAASQREEEEDGLGAGRSEEADSVWAGP
eukprot:g46786.t1